ncbi:hypothetical protein E5D57_006286 [Metarhizium anisopliae]|nr:hypothetical protein E5D57_006286 [Metarhizium anisopliae]
MSFPLHPSPVDLAMLWGRGLLKWDGEWKPYLGCKGAFVVPTPLLRSAKRMPKWRVCMLFTQNHTTHKPDLGQGLKGGSGSGLVSGGSTGGLEILALLDIPAAQRGCELEMSGV